jgi:hypothetical protein
MKKKLLVSLVVLCMSIPIFGAEELSELQNAVWRIAADEDDYVNAFAALVSGLPIDYRAQGDMTDLGGYLIVMLGQTGKLGTVYPYDVYRNFISRFDNDSFHYAVTVIVEEDNRGPQNVVMIADSISCDEHATKEVSLWKFNTTTKFFDLQGDVPVCAAGTCTFSGLANGYYVLGFTGNEFPSLSQFINE